MRTPSSCDNKLIQVISVKRYQLKYQILLLSLAAKDASRRSFIRVKENSFSRESFLNSSGLEAQ